MRKLNEKGWGMITFVVLISLLFFAIILISLLVNKIGGSLPLSSKKNSTYYLVDNYIK